MKLQGELFFTEMQTAVAAGVLTECLLKTLFFLLS
jgi:hypothetical protein